MYYFLNMNSCGGSQDEEVGYFLLLYLLVISKQASSSRSEKGLYGRKEEWSMEAVMWIGHFSSAYEVKKKTPLWRNSTSFLV
jgi:hypothetical protein